MEQLSTAELVALLSSSNEEAFNELYRRYHKLVRYIAFQLTRNSADADEVVQEVFIQIQKSITTLKDPNLLKAWISRITYSKAKMLFRSNKDFLMDDEEINRLHAKHEMRIDFMPDVNSRRQANLQVLYECILKLSNEYREVIVMFYFGQLSIKEIADIQRVPTGTVKSRLSYAKKKLSKIVHLYEVNSNDKITFYGHSLSASLLYLGASMINAKPKPFFMFKKGIQQFTVLPVQSVVILSAVTLSVSGATYFAIQHIARDMLPDSALTSFPSVTYHNQNITNPKDAYQVLLAFSHCEVELREKQDWEIVEINPVYEALKSYGEGYYNLLVRSDWTIYYEEKRDNEA